MKKNKKTLKLIALFLFQITIIQCVYSNPIDVEIAKQLASKFYSQRLHPEKQNSTTIIEVSTIEKSGYHLMYVVNFEDGFVITSANDEFIPIVAYSSESPYPINNTPEVINFWLRQYTEPMLMILKNHENRDRDHRWDALEMQLNSKTTPIITGIQPLLTSRWNQAENYNDSCPEISGGPNGRCYAGCVATSMGQIMYYHKYPASGNGIHFYNHPHFGDISVNYGNATYDWNAMGNVATGNTRGEISKLIYHCGVSVDMNYGPTGSGSNTELALSSFIEHFGYRTDARYIERSAYGLFEWRRLIIDNLYNNMPVLYSGNDASAGGHAWVCDGVNDSLYFHMNWGWSGAGNGYFLLDSLNSGNGNFSNYQSAIINIAPIYQEYCIHDKEYFENEMTFNDGSNLSPYKNNSDCRYTITTDSFQVRINFIYFNTEQNNDVLNIFDGEDVNAPLIGSYSGNNLPPVLYSSGNKMYLQFLTNDTIQNQGWELRYVRYKPTGIIEEQKSNSINLTVSPNPSNDKISFTPNFENLNDIEISLMDISGRLITIEKVPLILNGSCQMDIGYLPKGVYWLKVASEKSIKLAKIIKL